MTTTVTITAHAWPVEVVVTDSYPTDCCGGNIYHAETYQLPPHTVRDLHLTSTRSIAFRELPIPHADDTPLTGIDQVDVVPDEVEHHQV